MSEYEEVPELTYQQVFARIQHFYDRMWQIFEEAKKGMMLKNEDYEFYKTRFLLMQDLIEEYNRIFESIIYTGEIDEAI